MYGKIQAHGCEPRLTITAETTQPCWVPFSHPSTPQISGFQMPQTPHSQLAGFGLRHSGYGAGVARSCPNSKWKTNIGEY